MACLNADGTLTMVTRAVLEALISPADTQTVAARTGLPLYRVRATLREVHKHLLVECCDDVFSLTALGREVLEEG